MRDHWDGAVSSNLAKRLVVDGMVENISEGRGWITENVAIRWGTANELDTCTRRAKQFAIAVLRPRFNK